MNDLGVVAGQVSPPHAGQTGLVAAVAHTTRTHVCLRSVRRKTGQTVTPEKARGVPVGRRELGTDWGVRVCVNMYQMY